MYTIAFTPESSSQERYACNNPNNGSHGQSGQELYQSGNSYATNAYHPQDGDNAKARGSQQRASPYSKHRISKLHADILMWAGMLTATLFVYFCVSSGDFSFWMTFGAIARMFGFGILNTKVWTQGPSGVSSKTLMLYAVVFASRLTSILRHEGYLPYDKSGDWMYHVIEGLSLVFTMSALFACLKRGGTVDTFGGNGHIGALTLAVPMLIVAVFIHPNLNSDFLSDASWTYAMYLESVALIPQLSMFQQKKKQAVEWLTAHFVAALGVGRVLELVFWVESFTELSTTNKSTIPGYVTLLAQIMQLLLLLNFFTHYYYAVKNKTDLILPSTNDAMGMV